VRVSLGEDYALDDNDKHHYHKHTCQSEVKVTHKKNKICIDQFRFKYKEESGTESETDDPDEEEIWECVEKKCKAVVKIKKDLVQTHTKHTCQISLKMEIDQDYGTLDGYIFRKDAGSDGEKSIWFCDSQGCKGKSKGCKIQTTGEENKLLYPHTSAMHKCNDFTQNDQENEDFLGLHIEEDNDDGFEMLGMFE